MAATYTIIRWILMVVLGIGLVMEILGFLGLVVATIGNPAMIIYLVLALVAAIVTAIGFYGAYEHNRACLVTFGVLQIIGCILAILTAQFSVLSSILIIILAFWQAKLVKQGESESDA